MRHSGGNTDCHGKSVSNGGIAQIKGTLHATFSIVLAHERQAKGSQCTLCAAVDNGGAGLE